MAYYYKELKGEEVTFYTDNLTYDNFRMMIPPFFKGKVNLLVLFTGLSQTEYYSKDGCTPALEHLKDEITWLDLSRILRRESIGELDIEFDSVRIKYCAPFQYVFTMPEWRFTRQVEKILMREYFFAANLVKTIEEHPGEMVTFNADAGSVSHRKIPSLKFWLEEMEPATKWKMFRDRQAENIIIGSEDEK